LPLLVTVTVRASVVASGAKPKSIDAAPTVRNGPRKVCVIATSCTVGTDATVVVTRTIASWAPGVTGSGTARRWTSRVACPPAATVPLDADSVYSASSPCGSASSAAVQVAAAAPWLSSVSVLDTVPTLPQSTVPKAGLPVTSTLPSGTPLPLIASEVGAAPHTAPVIVIAAVAAPDPSPPGVYVTVASRLASPSSAPAVNATAKSLPVEAPIATSTAALPWFSTWIACDACPPSSTSPKPALVGASAITPPRGSADSAIVTGTLDAFDVIVKAPVIAAPGVASTGTCAVTVKVVEPAGEMVPLDGATSKIGPELAIV
jgi:hypothetical protein